MYRLTECKRRRTEREREREDRARETVPLSEWAEEVYLNFNDWLHSTRGDQTLTRLSRPPPVQVPDYDFYQTPHMSQGDQIHKWILESFDEESPWPDVLTRTEIYPPRNDGHYQINREIQHIQRWYPRHEHGPLEAADRLFNQFDQCYRQLYDNTSMPTSRWASRTWQRIQDRMAKDLWPIRG